MPVMPKTSQKSKLKICVACSPGGHMVQARRLASVYEEHEHFYFTFSGPVARELEKNARVRTIPNVVKGNPVSLRVAVTERPDVVITTGAGVVVFLCLFCKLFGAKLIFLESMARVSRPTLTARMLYPFADLFLVQWPQLCKFFSKAKYVGRVL